MSSLTQVGCLLVCTVTVLTYCTFLPLWRSLGACRRVPPLNQAPRYDHKRLAHNTSAQVNEGGGGAQPREVNPDLLVGDTGVSSVGGVTDSDEDGGEFYGDDGSDSGDE